MAPGEKKALVNRRGLVWGVMMTAMRPACAVVTRCAIPTVVAKLPQAVAESPVLCFLPRSCPPMKIFIFYYQ
jgi:hypothetical protein